MPKNEQRTENREQKTENGEQRTENREQRTENRERRTENREQRTEIIIGGSTQAPLGAQSTDVNREFNERKQRI